MRKGVILFNGDYRFMGGDASGRFTTLYDTLKNSYFYI